MKSSPATEDVGPGEEVAALRRFLHLPRYCPPPLPLSHMLTPYPTCVACPAAAIPRLLHLHGCRSSLLPWTPRRITIASESFLVCV
jgi:hypothetical protein